MANTISRHPFHWKRQPIRGLLFLAAATLASLVLIHGLLPLIGLPIVETLSYTFTFFFWGFVLLSLFEGWPFSGVAQPWQGLLMGALAVLLTVLSWQLLAIALTPAGDDATGTQNAQAVFSYAMFFLFMLAWFYDTWPVAHLKQPGKGLILFCMSVVGGLLVYVLIGAISQMWLYFVPMWLVPLALDYWPTAKLKPALKGTVWLALILAATWLTDILFALLGFPIDSPHGSDFASLLFGGMIYLYTFEGWPFQAGKQPMKGMWLIAITLLIGIGLNLFFELGELLASAWIFLIWVWLIIFQWLTYPWPAADS